MLILYFSLKNIAMTMMMRLLDKNAHINYQCLITLWNQVCLLLYKGIWITYYLRHLYYLFDDYMLFILYGVYFIQFSGTLKLVDFRSRWWICCQITTWPWLKQLIF